MFWVGFLLGNLRFAVEALVLCAFLALVGINCCCHFLGNYFLRGRDNGGGPAHSESLELNCEFLGEIYQRVSCVGVDRIFTFNQIF